MTLIRMFAYICLATMMMLTACAADSAYREGRDYEVVPDTQVAPNLEPDKITILEFFSYGCPVCNRVEPFAQQWLSKLSSDVSFKRVPVTFESGWDVYAKAYYIADAFGVEHQISSKLFKAIHEEEQTFKTAQEMAKFFNKNAGIAENKFTQAYQYSPSLDAQVKSGGLYMRSFKITGVPTFVIDNRYKVNLSNTQGDVEEMFKIVNFLIEKIRKEKK